MLEKQTIPAAPKKWCEGILECSQLRIDRRSSWRSAKFADNHCLKLSTWKNCSHGLKGSPLAPVHRKSRRSKPNSASVYLDCSKRKENVLGGQRSTKSSRSYLTQSGVRTRPYVIRPVKFRRYGKAQKEQQTDEPGSPRSRWRHRIRPRLKNYKRPARKTGRETM